MTDLRPFLTFCFHLQIHIYGDMKRENTRKKARGPALRILVMSLVLVPWMAYLYIPFISKHFSNQYMSCCGKQN